MFIRLEKIVLQREFRYEKIKKLSTPAQHLVSWLEGKQTPRYIFPAYLCICACE